MEGGLKWRGVAGRRPRLAAGAFGEGAREGVGGETVADGDRIDDGNGGGGRGGEDTGDAGEGWCGNLKLEVDAR